MNILQGINILESRLKNKEPHVLPLEIIKLVELNQQEFIDTYNSDAGVWEKYTIREHTLMAMTQFEKYFSNKILPFNFDKNLFRLILALHDIGKPIAISKGNKNKQYTYNKQYVRKFIKTNGTKLSHQQESIVDLLVGSDYLGRCIRYKSIETLSNKFSKYCAKNNLPSLQIFELIKIFYLSDASAYTLDASIPGVIKSKESLDYLFSFDYQKKSLTLSKEAKRKSNIFKNILYEEQRSG